MRLEFDVRVGIEPSGLYAEADPGRCLERRPRWPFEGAATSVQAISWVIEHSKAKANPFVVLLMIANHARSDGTGAWPSLKTVAREARISRRTVWACVNELEKIGELVVHRHRGKKHTNYYDLPLVQKMQELHLSDTAKGANGGSKRCNSFAPEPSFTEPSKKERQCSACLLWFPPLALRKHQCSKVRMVG